MKYWEAEDAEPVISKGTCETKMLLGGHYQQSIYKGDVNGTPFEGIGYVVYDNAKKMYVNTWIDNMGKDILYPEGSYAPNNRTTQMIGKRYDPATYRPKGMRQVTHNLDDNTQIIEMYETRDNGRKFKSMEIKFSKKQFPGYCMAMRALMRHTLPFKRTNWKNEAQLRFLRNP